MTKKKQRHLYEHNNLFRRQDFAMSLAKQPVCTSVYMQAHNSENTYTNLNKPYRIWFYRSAWYWM